MADFAQALSDNQSRDELFQLLRQIVEVLGIGYRQQVIAALEAKGSSDALAKAAILAWQEDHQLAQPLRVKQLLDRALAIDPDDAFVRFVAATFCGGPMEDQCAQPDAAEQLVRVQPDDGYSWLVLAARRKGPDAYAALHEAVSRKDFGRQLARMRNVHVDAMVEAGVAPPALVAEPARILVPDQAVEITVGHFESWSRPMFVPTQIVRMCNPQAGFPAMPDDAGARADCIAVGTRMAMDSGYQMMAAFGAIIVAGVAPGSEEDLAIQAQANRMAYLAEVLSGLTSTQNAEYSAARYDKDQREVGEIEAMVRKAAHFGFPTEPPAGWKSPRERALAASGS